MSITLQSNGLSTAILNLDVATTKHDIEASEKTFKSWTRGKIGHSSIYSGYANRVLEAYELNETLALSQKLHAQFDHMVVLGIGGSALGTKAIYSAMKWSLKGNKKLHVLDNLDPVLISQTLQEIPFEKTCFCVISKSGGTIETMAQFALVLKSLKEKNLSVTHHVVAVTDPTQGTLRQWVHKHGVAALSVPADVGGRFSAFTPVGLLPLAFVGFDVKKLLSGAQDIFKGEGISNTQLWALAQRVCEMEAAFYSAHLLMPYASVLKEIGEWFVQLWGESLGKTRSQKPAVGSIPLVAIGATDQHSLLQLLVEGPKQVLTAFVEVKKWPHELDVKIPEFPQEFAKLSYASGKSLSEVLNAELEATSQVFKNIGRPFYKITLDTLSLESVGALMAFYMDLVSACGTLHDLNPYNQPGVELGKDILPTLLEA